MIKLKLSTQDDLQILTEFMTSAFNFDTAYYFGEGKCDGPSGYDNGVLAEKVMKNKSLTTYLISKKDQIVGFITLDYGQAILDLFCIKPEFMGQGIGTTVWRLIEENHQNYPWVVETPGYSKRNHHFYEKLGFKKYAEKRYADGSVSFLFRLGDM